MEEFYTESHTSLQEVLLSTLGCHTQPFRSAAVVLITDRAPGGQEPGTSAALKEGDSVAGSEG